MTTPVIPMEVLLYYVVPHAFSNLKQALQLMLVCPGFNKFSERREFWEVFLLRRKLEVIELCKLGYKDMRMLEELLTDHYIMWPAIIEENYGVKAVVQSKFFVSEQVNSLWNELYLSCHHLYGTEDDSDYEGESSDAESENSGEEYTEDEEGDEEVDEDEEEGYLECVLCSEKFFDLETSNFCLDCLKYETDSNGQLQRDIQFYENENNHVRKTKTKCKSCLKSIPEANENMFWCQQCKKALCPECVKTHDDHPKVDSGLRFKEAVRDPNIAPLDLLCMYSPSFTSFGCYTCLFTDRPALSEGLIIQGGIRFGIKYTGWRGDIYQGLVFD